MTGGIAFIIVFDPNRCKAALGTALFFPSLSRRSPTLHPSLTHHSRTVPMEATTTTCTQVSLRAMAARGCRASGGSERQAIGGGGGGRKWPASQCGAAGWPGQLSRSPTTPWCEGQAARRLHKRARREDSRTASCQAPRPRLAGSQGALKRLQKAPCAAAKGGHCHPPPHSRTPRKGEPLFVASCCGPLLFMAQNCMPTHPSDRLLVLGCW